VRDYNEAVKERNNANGSYITAQNYLRRGKESDQRKTHKALYEKSLEWIKVAMANINQAEKMLDKVKKGGCPATLVENAGSLTQKNFTDNATYDLMKKDLEMKLSLFK